MKSPKGFLLLETLIAIMLFAIIFSAFIGLIRQALLVSHRMKEMILCRNDYEKLLFQMEAGLRPDIVAYGNKGSISQETFYEIESVPEADGFFLLKGRLSRLGRSYIDSELYLSEAPLQ